MSGSPATPREGLCGRPSPGVTRCTHADPLPKSDALINMIAMISEMRRLVASITIRNLDETVKRKLRLRAAQRNRSMEDEARDILRTALAQEPTQHGNLADAIRRRIEPLGGVDLPLPARGPMRDPPDFA